jgi:hypothetical protein
METNRPTVPDPVRSVVEPVDQSEDLTRAFIRLSNLPSYPLDRLSRYEATLWRQACQILFTLRCLDQRKAVGAKLKVVLRLLTQASPGCFSSGFSESTAAMPLIIIGYIEGSRRCAKSSTSARRSRTQNNGLSAGEASLPV